MKNNSNIQKHFYQEIDGWFDFNNLYSHMVRTLPENSTIVELGTFKGKSSCFLLVECHNSGKKFNLHFCDTFEGSPEHFNETYDTFRPEITKNPNELYDTFMGNISKCNYPCKIHKCSSLDLVNDFEDNSIDFIFFDTAHEYDHVIKELKLWYPKVKIGGFLSGHDYIMGDNLGVRRAVNEFFIENVQLLLQPDGGVISYLVKKEFNYTI